MTQRVGRARRSRRARSTRSTRRKEATVKRSQTRKRAKSKKRFKIPVFVIILVVSFGLMLFLLLLHSYNLSLNEEVKALQEELKAVESEIDSKNGRIISNADIKAIESQARALGMTEAQPSQYVYEASAKKQTTITDTPVGLNDYIRFFKQVRKEKLWPVTQQEQE